MPLLAALIKACFGTVFGFLAAMLGAQTAVRVAAVASIGALYIASVTAFSLVIAPWIGSVFSTQYGQLLGLLFPPVAGTVIAALYTYYMGVVTYRYIVSLTKIAAG